MFVGMGRQLNVMIVVVLFPFFYIYFFFGLVGGGVVVGVMVSFGRIVHLFSG